VDNLVCMVVITVRCWDRCWAWGSLEELFVVLLLRGGAEVAAALDEDFAAAAALLDPPMDNDESMVVLCIRLYLLERWLFGSMSQLRTKQFVTKIF